MQNIVELRNLLLDNIEKMKNGEMNIRLGREITRAASVTINSLRIELDANIRDGVITPIPFLQNPEIKK